MVFETFFGLGDIIGKREGTQTVPLKGVPDDPTPLAVARFVVQELVLCFRPYYTELCQSSVRVAFSFRILKND